MVDEPSRKVGSPLGFAGSPHSKTGDTIRHDFLEAAYAGHIEQVTKYLDNGANIDCVDPATGLTALHVAVGHDNLPLATLLVDRGAAFTSDKLGRWPSTMAADCKTSDAMCDFIVEAEAKATANLPD